MFGDLVHFRPARRIASVGTSKGCPCGLGVPAIMLELLELPHAAAMHEKASLGWSDDDLRAHFKEEDARLLPLLLKVADYFDANRGGPTGDAIRADVAKINADHALYYAYLDTGVPLPTGTDPHSIDEHGRIEDELLETYADELLAAAGLDKASGGAGVGADLASFAIAPGTPLAASKAASKASSSSSTSTATFIVPAAVVAGAAALGGAALVSARAFWFALAGVGVVGTLAVVSELAPARPPRLESNANAPAAMFPLAAGRAGLPGLEMIARPSFSSTDKATSTICCDKRDGQWTKVNIAERNGGFDLGGKFYTIDLDSVVPAPHHFAPDGTPIVQREFGGLPGAGVTPNDRPDNLGKSTLLETDAHGRQYWSTNPAPGVFVLVFDPDPGGDFTGSVDWGEYLQTLAATVATVASFVPGIGTGVSVVIVGAAALARGAALSDAFVAGVRSSLPGGPIAEAAFDVAYGLSKGENIGDASLEAVRNQVPPEARASFDEAKSVLEGKNVSDAAEEAALSTIRDQLPEGAGRDAFDVAIAVGKGRKIQEATVAKIAPSLPASSASELAWRIGNGQKVQDAALAVGGPALENKATNLLGGSA